MGNIRAYLALSSHKACKLFGKEVYYEGRGGIKVLNRKANPATHSKSIYTQTLNSANVRLFVDALKDEFTLVSRTIAESPHYDLVSRILKGQTDISATDYVMRESQGILDGRFELVISDNYLHSHLVATNKTRKSILEGNYKHPRVFHYNGDYYALDGKHRLAVATSLSKDLVCEVVPVENVINSHYIQSVMKEMRKRECRYRQNLSILNSIIYDVSK